MTRVHSIGALAFSAVAWLGTMGQAVSQTSTPLDRAREAFNAGRYDAAIAAAREAQMTAALANPAAVVLGRAHLERFRADSNRDDLAAARGALATVRPAELLPKDEVAFLMSQGMLLYLDGCVEGCFSASAELFGLALARADRALVGGAEREAIFEWWAGALDRQAQYGQAADRPWIYRRLLAGADEEVAAHPDSASATYWIAVAARGFGDHERAWGAAVAGWVRARDFGTRGEKLRADLDRFVTLVLLPERARLASPDADPRPAYEQLLAQWKEIKKKYPSTSP